MHYAFFIGLALLIILIIYQKWRSKDVKPSKKILLDHELVALKKMPQITDKYNWLVIVKSMEGYKSVYEENDLAKVGYYICCNYKEELTARKISVYIKDSLENRYLKIVADGSSESMVGVDHPELGHIGYLSFEVIE